MAGQLGKKASIGQLRHRLVLEECVEPLDRFRGSEKTWVERALIRGEVTAVGGRELFQNGVTQAQATHRVRIRWRGDITPKHRLRWLDTGAILNPVSCPPEVGTSNIIELMCIVER